MMNEKGIRMMKKWMSVMLLLALLLAPCAAWAADYAATIGSTGYATLDAAIDAGSGKTIVLQKNNTIAAYKELKNKGNITIDLNGYQINQALVLQGNTALTIMDGKSGGKLYTGADSGTTYAIFVENGASVSIVNGHVYRDGTPVYVNKGGSVSVSGGKVEGKTFEAIVALPNTTVNISGGEVIGGGLGVNSSGVVNVTGGKIQGGQGEYDCAVNIANDGKLNVSGGEFTGGKAIWMEKADQVSFTGSGYSLNGNTAELALTPTDGKTLALSDVACEGWRIYAYIYDLPAQSVSLPDGLSLLYNNAAADKVPGGKVGKIGRAQKATFEVTAAASPAAGGTVTGGGTYEEGKTATLIAAANTGYTFVNWTKGSEVVSANATCSVTEAGNYVANFALNSYTITVNATEGGAASGGGTYDHGESVTLTATAKTGYSFVNWTKGGEVVSTSAEYTFTAAENAELVANFELNSYTITAAANPAAGGTVTGGGTVKHGAGVTLTATANDGYSFVNWTKGGEVVSTDAAYTFTAEADAELVANFVEDKPAEYTVTAMPNMTEGGTVTGGGTYAAGTTATLTAAANEGFVFEKWQKNDADVSTENPYTVTVTENAAYTAVFTKVLPGPDPEPTLYTVKAAASPAEGGTIAGLSEDGKYEENTAVTLEATAAEGYAFVNWTKDGEVVSADAAYTFTVTADANLLANFEATKPEPEAQYKPFDGGLTNDCVTDALRSKNITTAEDIRQKMMAAFTEMGMISGNVAHYDITLMVSTDGGKTWEPAAEIPEGGYVAEIPLPSGSDPLLHNFIVLHMFARGERAGEVERPAFEIANGKLFIHMTSFSPVSVAWQDKNLQAAGDAAQDLPQTGDASSLGLWTALLLGTAGLAALRKKRREA